MTPEAWFTIARDLILLVVGALVFYWGLARKQQEDNWRKDLALRDLRLDSMERRLEAAGAKMSDLAGDTQVLIGRFDQFPERLREIFLDRVRAEEMIEESRRDRLALWQAVRDRPRQRKES